jgi:glucose/arabinose dehydrogenase
VRLLSLSAYLSVALWLVIGIPRARAQVLVEDAFPLLQPPFTRPVGLENAGDGSNRLFVVEQAGKIHVFANDTLVTTSKVFLDITANVDSDGGEEGLLGLAFHPQYPDSPYVYVNYTTNIPTTHTQISRFTVTSNPDSADATSELPILEIPKPFANHNSGELEFGPDGYLYIGTGDGGGAGDPNGNGQDLTTLLAAILRIDVDNPQSGANYGIPADNPFVGNVSGYKEEIWAYGFRNPWRFSFDLQTDSLWVGDVGQNLWEEIDIARKGENYGWSIMEGNHCYATTTCDMTGLSLPVWEYFHDSGRRSITGGYVYRGSEIPDIFGLYIYADYSTGEIWSLEWDGATATNNLLVDVPTLISSFGVDESEELYFVALVDGRIYKLVRDPNTPVLVSAFSGIAADEGVTLTWQITADEGFQGFILLREGDGTSVLLPQGAPLPATARQFSDTTALPGKAYRYTLIVVMNGGEEQRGASITVDVPAAPNALYQNHPNPFNPGTTIEFSLKERSFVTLDIYDVRGAHVRTLVDGWRNAGRQSAAWDGRDQSGARQATGVYFYKLTTDGVAVATKRMVLLK